MAFPQTARVIKVELFLSGNWINVTTDIYARDGITITRGRRDETSTAEPSACSLTINNRSGNYSPRNPTGIYYGIIGRNTPIRVSVELASDTFTRTVASGWGTSDTGQTYTLGGVTGTISATDLSVSGGSGKISIPVANALRDATMSYISMRDVEVAYTVTLTVPSITGAAIAALVNFRYSGTNYAFAWVVFNTDGTISLGIIDNAPFTNVYPLTVIPGLTYSSGTGYRVRAQAEGSTFRAKVWAASGNEPYAWQATGRSTSPLTPGPINIQGWVFTGNTNTLPVVMSIDNIVVRSVRFTGEVSSWPQRWDVSGSDAYAPVVAAGITRRLRQGTSPVSSTLYTLLTTSSLPPVAYWPCEDGERSSRLASAFGDPAMTMYGASKLASYSGFPCSGPVPTVEAATWVGNVPPYTSTGNIQLRYLMHMPTGGIVVDGLISQLFTAGSAHHWEIKYAGSSLIYLQCWTVSNTLLFTSINYVIDNLEGSNFETTLELTQNGGNVDWAIDATPFFGVSPNRHTGTLAGATIGRATRVVISPFAQLVNTAIGHVRVQKELLAPNSATTLLSYTQESALNRIIRLCTSHGISLSHMDGYIISELVGPQHVDSLLTLITEAADADQGTLYEPRGDIGLAYRTLGSLYLQASTVDLDYTFGQIAPPLEPVDDDQGTRNDVTATRTDGSSARAELITGRMSTLDPASGGVGRYDTQVTVNVASDDQLPDIAGWLMHLGTVDETRYPTVTVNLASPAVALDAVTSQSMLDLSIDDRFTISNPKTGQTPNQITQLARGYSERLNVFEHSVAINSAPENPYETIVLDVASVKVDGNASSLASGVTTTATSLSVATTDGVMWTTSAGQWPFSIGISGERMTVTAVSGASSPQTFTVIRSINGVVKTHSAGEAVRLFFPATLSL